MLRIARKLGFNTQPPEGGWPTARRCFRKVVCFNTQPPEGGWTHSRPKAAGYAIQVSTHSRPKAAGRYAGGERRGNTCFNTQPPEGGWVMRLVLVYRLHIVSTHSRPKAAGVAHGL